MLHPQGGEAQFPKLLNCGLYVVIFFQKYSTEKDKRVASLEKPDKRFLIQIIKVKSSSDASDV